MKTAIIAVLVALFAGCTSIPAQGQIIQKINSDLLINDFTAAQANYTAAAAAQPAGSPLAVQFTASAACMTDVIAKLQPTTTASESNKGLVSLASIIDIQVSVALANKGITSSVNCDAMVGHIINNLNSQVINALPVKLLLP